MRRGSLLLLCLLVACESEEIGPRDMVEEFALSKSERESLASTTLFFGHQSVGGDLLAGISELAPELRIHEGDGSAHEPAAGWTHAFIGRNGDPASKDEAFLEATTALEPGAVAFYKYCYVDMGPETVPQELFERYEQTLEAASRGGVCVLAVTMPLTTVAPPWKRAIKSMLGKTTDLELNAKRHEFNELVRNSSTAHALLDLARFESTLEDQSRRQTSYRGQQLELLASEFTDDGAHLNSRGRRHVATCFLHALSQAIRG